MRPIQEKEIFQKRFWLKWKKKSEQITLLAALALLVFPAGDETYQIKQRRFLISEIEITALANGLHTGLYQVDKKVLSAMARVPRVDFLGARYEHFAYKNVALFMKKERQIIPEPFLSAMMIHLMGVHKNDKVLEIGFGTGYEAAILSKLANKVYSIKQENPLGKAMQVEPEDALDDYPNIQSKIGNGLLGWKDKGAFDAILVKQAVLEPPQNLIDQLKPYGRLVVPVEQENGLQRVMVYLKMPDGSLQERETLHVKMPHLLPGEDI